MKWNSTDIKPENKEKVIIDCEPIGITTTIYFTELESGPTKGWGIMGVKKWLPISVLDESPSNTVAPSVSEEGWTEEMAKEAYPQLDHVINSVTQVRNVWKEGYRAGANSIRQQGDAVVFAKWLRENFEPTGHIAYSYLIFEVPNSRWLALQKAGPP